MQDGLAKSSRSWLKIVAIVVAAVVTLCVGNGIFAALSDLDEPGRTPTAQPAPTAPP